MGWRSVLLLGFALGANAGCTLSFDLETSTTEHGEQDEVDVLLPPCDPSDPSVRFLTPADGPEGLEAPGARVFCLAPGEYWSTLNVAEMRREPIRIRDQPERVVRLYDPAHPEDETHPALLPPERQARLHLELEASTGVTFERVTFTILRVTGASRRNVFHRCSFERGSPGNSPLVRLEQGADGTVIQRSVFTDPLFDQAGDRDCLQLVLWEEGARTERVRVVRNEFIDCSRGLLLSAGAARRGAGGASPTFGWSTTTSSRPAPGGPTARGTPTPRVPACARSNTSRSAAPRAAKASTRSSSGETGSGAPRRETASAMRSHSSRGQGVERR